MPNTNFVSFSLTNLLVPAFGATKTLANTFNQANGYSLNINEVTIDDVPFRPQSVTIDASDVPTTETVTFIVRQIGYTRVINGGTTETFNYPAISNQIIDVTPSDGTSEVRGFFYNFPAFIDRSGATEVVLTALPPVDIATMPDVIISQLPPVEIASEATAESASVNITGAVTTAAVDIVPAPGAGNKIVLHAISVNGKPKTAAAESIATIESGVLDFLSVPIDATADRVNASLNFSAPIECAENTALQYVFSAAETLTGTLSIVVIYSTVAV